MAVDSEQPTVSAEPWFRTIAVSPSLDRIDEPHVHELLRANDWHLPGRDRDLIVDTGLGVASLRFRLSHLFERDPVVVLSHAHLDHMGGAHEFDRCWAHPDEPFHAPGSLYLQPLADGLGISTAEVDYDPTILLDAAPQREFALDDYRR